jgi:MSHA biogenesis protein MshP
MFIVVVLALLGTFMLTLSGGQHMTAADAVTGARAYYAARSGAEWGGAQATLSASCAAATLVFPAYPEFAVAVNCDNGGTTHTEAGVTYSVFRIRATATSTGLALGDPGYVSRTVWLIVTDGP